MHVHRVHVEQGRVSHHFLDVEVHLVSSGRSILRTFPIYAWEDIYLLHFMWRLLLLLQLMLIILTIGEKSALTLIVPEEAPAQARWMSHLGVQLIRLEGLSASKEGI